MSDKKRKIGFSTSGGSLLLVIFAVLCLTVFTLLALATVQADTRLSNTSREAVAQYYAADTGAETMLAYILNGTPPDNVKQNGNIYSFTSRISDTQQLVVEVLVEENNYTILRWQAVSTADWQPDDDINVWDGES